MLRRLLSFALFSLTLGSWGCAESTDSPATTAGADSTDGGYVDGSDGAADGSDGTGDATDGLDALDATDGGVPDDGASCVHLACPEGTACVGGRCEVQGETCAPTVERVMAPAWGAGSAAVAVADGYAWVATALGVEVYPVAAPETPVAVASLDLDGEALDVAVDGERLVVAHGRDGVTVVDRAALLAREPAVIARLDVLDAVAVAADGGRVAVVAAERVSLWDADGQPVGAVEVPGALGAAYDGNVLYVAAGTHGVVPVDVADPAHPVAAAAVVVGEGYEPPQVRRVRPHDGFLYAAAGYTGVRVLSLAAPLAPVEVGDYWVDSNGIVANDVSLDAVAQVLYVADFWHQAVALDVSDPAAPKVLGAGPESDTVTGIAAGDGWVWTTGEHLTVFELVEHTPMPRQTLGGPASYANVDVDVAGSRVGVVDGGTGVRFLDVVDGAPVEVGRYTPAERPIAVAVRGNHALVGVDTTQPFVATSRLDALDLSDPAAPVVVGSLDISGRAGDLMYADETTVYMAAGSLQILDVSGAPVVLPGAVTFESWAGRLDLEGDLLAVTMDYRGVALFDVSDRRAPKALGTVRPEGYVTQVGALGDHLYVGDADAVRVFDLADPVGLPEIGRVALPGPVRALDWRATPDGGELWVAADGAVTVLRGAERLPVASRATPGRNPQRVLAGDFGVLLSDLHEPLAIARLACEPGTPAVADAEPAPQGSMWVNVAVGTPSLRAEAGDLSVDVGFAAGTTPTALAGDAAWRATGGDVAVPGVGDELVIAAGDAAAPSVVRAVRQALPGDGAVRLRLINAAPGELAGVLHGAGAPVDLARPAPGQHGPSVDLTPSASLTLALAVDGDGLVARLPQLDGGHTVDAIVAQDAEGQRYVLLQRDDGQTQQVGAVTHTARVRVANFTQQALSVALEDEPVAGFDDVAPLGSTAFAAVWPGTTRVTVLAAGGAVVAEIPVLVLPAHGQATLAVLEGEDGVDVVVVPEFTGQQLSGQTEVRVFNALPGVGALDVRMRPEESTGAGTMVAQALGLGETSAPYRPKADSYQVLLDLDHDGTAERVWSTGYFPDYGFNVYLARDPQGRVRVGSQSPADGPINWVYAEDELAAVRVLNLTGREGLEIALPNAWSDQVQSNPIAPLSGTYRTRVRAGEITATLSAPYTQESWSWTGTVAAETASTVVFWDGPQGIASFVLHDGADKETDTSLRFVNTTDSPATAWFTGTYGAKGVLLGAAAPGSGTDAWSAGGEGALDHGWVRVDRDGDGTPELTYALTGAAWRGVTNAALVERPDGVGGTWPVLVVQGVDYLTEPSYAEELQARVRVVVLPVAGGTLELALDGVDLGLYGKPGYESGPAGPAYYAVTDFRSVVAGTHTLTVKGVEHPLELAGATRTTLLLVGEDLTLIRLDDPPAGTGYRVTPLNLSGGTVGFVAETGGLRPRWASWRREPPARCRRWRRPPGASGWTGIWTGRATGSRFRGAPWATRGC